MNRYTYEEISTGLEEKFSVHITEEQVKSFRELTGDINPLHCDSEYARASGYTDKVVFGMLTSSFVSTLCGVYLPGENSLIYDFNVSYPKPVYVGDTLTITGKVVEKSDALQMITIKWRIVNQKGECVAKGKIRNKVRER